MPQLLIEVAVALSAATLLGFLTARMFYRSSARHELTVLRDELGRLQRRYKSDAHEATTLKRTTEKNHRLLRASRRPKA